MGYFRRLRSLNLTPEFNERVEEIIWKCFYHEQSVNSLLLDYKIKTSIDLSSLKKLMYKFSFIKAANYPLKKLNHGIDKGLQSYLKIRSCIPKRDIDVIDEIIKDYKIMK